MKTLIFGNGWIGNALKACFSDVAITSTDIANEDLVEGEVERYRPERIINCAGRTGSPNIDACERDPVGTRRSNVTGAIVLASVAQKRGIHFTHMSSGCLYDGDAGGRGFTEEDPPNFLVSVYARSKAEAETALRKFDALQLRIRMPISEVPHPRNLLNKLAGYSKTFRRANSITVLEDFLPVATRLIEEKASGIFNVVNDGIEYHDELLDMYRRTVDPNHRFELIPFEDLAKLLVTGRSNCVLSTEKLRARGISLPPVAVSLPRLLTRYAGNLRNQR